MRSLVIWTIVAALVGVSAAYSISEGGKAAYAYLSHNQPVVYVAEKSQQAAVGLSQILTSFKRIPVERPTPPAEGRSVLADLSNMRLELYQDGQLVGSFKIASKGKKGTPWETPAGNYVILSKEGKHLSSIGKVWMPYSMQFFGNYFIHGWPYYENGKSVPPGYSGGCIRLQTDDAREVFEFVETGTPVFVFGVEGQDGTAARHYEKKMTKPPAVSARAYLVADLDSGEILAEKNPDMVLPIASISKLMTALVSLDAINQYQIVTVSRRAVATEGTSGNLKAGEEIEAGNLIYPLLLESSNDAAEALAEHYGRSQFIKLMNEKAKAVGLERTSFEDPSGLSPRNVSTVQDLFKLARYIHNHKPYVFDVSAKLGHTTVKHGWVNTNDLAAASYFLGGKNGFTDEAKETTLSLWSLPFAEEENRRLAVITLGSQSRKADAEALLNYVKKSIIFTPPSIKGDLTLSFVGDIMLDRGVESSVLKNGEGNFDWLFSDLGSLAQADILVGNLEGPVSDKGKDVGSQYSFRMAPAVAGALARAGFDVLSVANNHAGDWSMAAFRDSLERLARAGIVVVGGGTNYAAASELKVLEKNGYRVGFLGATDVGPNWLAATKEEAGILLASDTRWPETIKKAAAEVDILVLTLHFGEEYQKTPSDRQRTLAQMAVDNGADLVIGHHPHVTQPLEKYGDGLIAYSLGNFIFDQYFSPETMSGGLLEVKYENGKLVSAEEKKIILDEQYHPAISAL